MWLEKINRLKNSYQPEEWFNKQPPYIFLEIGLAVVFLLAFRGTFGRLLTTWLGDDNSHGFLIIPVAIYLLWRKNTGRANSTPAAAGWSLLSLFFALLLAGVGAWAGIDTLANLGLVVTIWAVALFLNGNQFLIMNGWELFLLIFMIPIPARLYALATSPLQLLATKASCWVLQLIGMPVFSDGNIINLPNVTLEIVNACSGLRSIVTIFVLAYIINCITLNSLPKKLLLLAVSIPIAMLVNVFRVIFVSIFAYHGNMWFVEGSGHILIGGVIFILSLQLLIISERAIVCFIKTN